MLFVAGISGCGLILFHVIRSYLQRLRLQHRLAQVAHGRLIRRRPSGEGGEMADMKKKIDDWMVRISFAEVDADQEGFRVTGEQVERKTRLALDRLRIVRSELGPGERMEGNMETIAPPRRVGGDLNVMILDDEPIVGKRLKPALEKSGFAVEVFERPRRGGGTAGRRRSSTSS